MSDKLSDALKQVTQVTEALITLIAEDERLRDEIDALEEENERLRAAIDAVRRRSVPVGWHSDSRTAYLDALKAVLAPLDAALAATKEGE